MAIPYGTTCRTLCVLARLTLAGCLVTAALTLWWPSLGGWSALTAAALVVWVFWLVWRIVDGDRRVPGHPLHWALAGLLVLAEAHALATALTTPADRTPTLGGMIETSLVVHVAVLGLLVLLVQDLLDGPDTGWVELALGLAATLGGLLGVIITDKPDGRAALALVGWSGLALLRAALAERAGPDGARGLWVHLLRGAGLGVGVLLILLAPRAIPWMLAAAGLAALSAGVLSRAGWLRTLAAPLAAWALAGAVATGLEAWPVLAWPSSAQGWLGSGEAALTWLGPWEAGLSALVALVGWAGGLLVLVVPLATLGAWLARARPDSPADARIGAAWVLAATAAWAAWLGPGGLFNPVVNVMLALTWALLPGRLGCKCRSRNGAWVLAMVLAVGILLGLGRAGSLVNWAALSYGLDDRGLHAVAGLLVTLVLLWLLGRRWWGAVAALAASALLAGLAEGAQQLLSDRSAQRDDVVGHCLGAALAAGLFVLSRVSLFCEYPSESSAGRPRAGPCADPE